MTHPCGQEMGFCKRLTWEKNNMNKNQDKNAPGMRPLPASPGEMKERGWDRPDIIVVTGDAYVDHPSFGAALIARFLDSLGLRVAVLSRPDWSNTRDFATFGPPRLFFAVTSGNVDSMVLKYTSARKKRSEDSYAPGGLAGGRPDRAAIVYSQRIREAFPGVPEKSGVRIVLGGMEASLRRFAHYDFWSGKVRRSILFDARADMLVFGAGERPLRELVSRLNHNEPWESIENIRGTCVIRKAVPDGWDHDPHGRCPGSGAPASGTGPTGGKDMGIVRLPGFESTRDDAAAFAEASRLYHRELNPWNARPVVQRHGDRLLLANPPSLPLSTRELDSSYGLPFSRRPHQVYRGEKIPAFEMIRHSVTISRGCYGGCSFCAVALHEGGIVQHRSERSIIAEIGEIAANDRSFNGTLTDLGGATANMWRTGCRLPDLQKKCRKRSCLFPEICSFLDTDQGPLVNLYRRARSEPGVKFVRISSGIRHDLALRHPEYIRELVRSFTGGQLKIAPEHVSPGVLAMMGKPPISEAERFIELFRRYSSDAGKKQYILAYFIPAHPGSGDDEMLEAALWMKKYNIRTRQIQEFLPAPMTRSTTMFHSGIDPDNPAAGRVRSAKGDGARKDQKALLLHYIPAFRNRARKVLRRMGKKL